LEKETSDTGSIHEDTASTAKYWEKLKTLTSKIFKFRKTPKRQYPKTQTPRKSNYVIDMLVSLLTQTIMKEQDLFIKLKRLQKTLDELDIEGIHRLLLSNQPKLSDPSLEEWKLIVDEYKKRTNNENGLNMLYLLLKKIFFSFIFVFLYYIFIILLI